MADARDRAIQQLLKENERRNREILAGFNPLTGRGAPGPRVKVKIPDHPIPVQYMPERCVHHNLLIRKLLKHGSIKKYITDEMGWEMTDEHFQDVVYAS